jgi:group I intron endonuclease
MSIKSGVYKISLGSRCFYYGSSQDLNKRKMQHLNSLKNQKHYNIAMQRAWNKYESFEFEIVEECEIENLLNREQFYLDLYFDNKHNLNINKKADSILGLNLSEETKTKISKALTGRTLSEEHKERLRKPKSEQAKSNMKLAQQDRSIEIRNKISKTLTGHSLSQETKNKISESLKGNKQSEETNKKRSESLKKTWEKRKAAA